MDKKIQRIVGLLVIFALVTLLSPLLFGQDEAPIESASIEPPPFPPLDYTPDAPIAIAKNTIENPIEESVKRTVQNENSIEITQEMADAINNKANENTSGTSSNTNKKKSADDTPSVNDDMSLNKKSPHLKKTKKISPQKKIALLKKTAWAVQMGSFKDKNNAHRLANRLRAAGYQAFTRAKNNSTRVYIGPEFKEASAVRLSNKVAEEVRLQGMIVNYQPLTL